MTIVDAFAIIAFLRNEAARSEVEQLLRGNEVCRASTINASEIVDVLSRLSNVSPMLACQKLRLLELGGLVFEPADTPTALLAGRLRAAHYHRKDCAISLADCFALALAKTKGEALATADPALATVTRTEEVELIALPDTRGHRPH